MIKTVELTGTEMKVEGLDGKNTAIYNKSSSAAVYASCSPNITPNADGVMEVPAGAYRGLNDTCGIVYLLGAGKVELTGTDDAINFKLPSSSTGGGGEIPTEPMPVMAGIESIYAGINVPPDISGTIRVAGGNNYPKTIYAVLKAQAESNCACLLTRAVSTTAIKYGMNILSDHSTNRGIFGSSMGENLITPNPNNPLEYAVVALSADYTNHTLKGYINGTQLVSQDTGATTITCYPTYYKGHFLINDEDFNNKIYDERVGCDVAFLAFGFETHSNEQMVENSEWLMSKYLGR